jgi:hypothetical protein
MGGWGGREGAKGATAVLTSNLCRGFFVANRGLGQLQVLGHMATHMGVDEDGQATHQMPAQSKQVFSPSLYSCWQPRHSAIWGFKLNNLLVS